MYVKVTTSGPRRYVQLIESFRDDDGRVKKRTVATLGRADQLSGELDSVIAGLLKVAGREPVKLLPAISASSLSFESARALGNVWTLTAWCETRQVFRYFRIDRIAHVTVLEDHFRDEPDKSLALFLRRVSASAGQSAKPGGAP